MQLTGGIDYGTRRDPEHIARVLEDQGVPHELLTAASAARRWPGVDFHGPVLFHPQAGTVDAALAVSTSHRIAKRRGAVVLDDTLVQRIDVVDDHQALVVTNHGTVRAGRVIVAAGGWEQQLLGGLVPMPDLTVTQQQVFHFPRRDITADWPVIIHQGELDTYSLPGGRDGGPLGGRKVAESLGTVTTAEGRSGIVDPAARERITDYVRKCLPGLIPEPFNETTCLYTSTANGDFILTHIHAGRAANPRADPPLPLSRKANGLRRRFGRARSAWEALIRFSQADRLAGHFPALRLPPNVSDWNLRAWQAGVTQRRSEPYLDAVRWGHLTSGWGVPHVDADTRPTAPRIKSRLAWRRGGGGGGAPPPPPHGSAM